MRRTVRTATGNTIEDRKGTLEPKRREKTGEQEIRGPYDRFARRQEGGLCLLPDPSRFS